jgi:Ca2+-binding EF-hand superfamily protein
MSIGAISSLGGGYDSTSINEMRQAIFQKWDTNGDGSIDASECQSAAETMSQETGLSITADQMMAIFDLNEDGAITQAEQTEASPTWEQHMADLMGASGMGPMGPPPPPPPGDATSELADLADQIFAAMDTDEDGVISKTEYEAAMEQLAGQSDGTTASSVTSDSTTTASTSDSTSTEATSSTEDTSLAALLSQFLDLLAMLQQDEYSQWSQTSQYSLGLDYYA